MPINALWYLTPIFLALAGGICLIGWGRRLWKRGEGVGGAAAIGCGVLCTALGLLGWSAMIMVERRVTITGTVVGVTRINRVSYVEFQIVEEPESSAYVRTDLFASAPVVGETRDLVLKVNRGLLDDDINGYGIELPGAPRPASVEPTRAWLSSQRVDLLFGRGRPTRP